MNGVTDITTRLSSAKTGKLTIDLTALNTQGYQLVKNYGTDVERFELEFNRISNKQLYYSERLGVITHQYKAELASYNLSEDPTTGGFHTDFWVQPSPPPYIAALCTKADPRYPYFGRTQIAHVNAFVARMEQAFGITKDELLTYKLTYRLADKIRFFPILEMRDGRLVFRFHESLFDKEQPTPFDRDGSNFYSMIRAVLLDISNDFCLNTGDLMIMSNEIVLHRRNECSHSFNIDTNTWESREMATLRFFL